MAGRIQADVASLVGRARIPEHIAGQVRDEPAVRMPPDALLLTPRPSVTARPGDAPIPAGTIRHIPDFASRFLPDKRDLWVYLPPGYDASSDRYPVLYMHDGQNLFYDQQAFGGNSWQVNQACDRLIASGQLSPLIVVGIANTPDRIDDYTWVPGDVNGTPEGGWGPRYAQFLTEELKPFIDQNFRTRPDRENTGVMGSSLGGLIDIYLGRYDSATFGKIGIMSPSVWWDDRAVLGAATSMPTDLKIWLDVGDREGDEPAQTAADAVALKQELLMDGYQQGKNLGWFEDPMGGHDELAWRYRTPMALKFLFGSQSA